MSGFDEVGVKRGRTLERNPVEPGEQSAAFSLGIKRRLLNRKKPTSTVLYVHIGQLLHDARRPFDPSLFDECGIF